jgi:hypothetical protein
MLAGYNTCGERKKNIDIEGLTVDALWMILMDGNYLLFLFLVDRWSIWQNMVIILLV